MTDSHVINAISEALNPLIEENAQLKESIGEVRAMMAYEDRGWSAILGMNSGDRENGLSLDEVKLVAEKASTQVAAGALPKRAADLHFGFIFGNGVEFEGVERERGKKGAPTGSVRFFEDSVNQESIFSGAAKHELQYERFTTGNVLAFCNTSSKSVRRVPITEITNVMVNPDHPDEIWAYLRTWTHVNLNGESEERKAWAYTNRFPNTKKNPRQASIKTGNKLIKTLPDVTVVDLRANRQVGWTFGVPDAVSGLHWTQAYGEVLRYGQIVNETLAKVVYKVVQTTRKGAADTGVKLGKGGPGQAAVLGQGQDIQMVNASQSSFNFAAARPLAAMAAAAWNISVIDLLADSSAAGSSYGSAQALTAGIQNAMNGMREEWSQFYADIFEVMGLGRPAISWPPMEKPDSYRMAQELTLYSIALTDEEYREEVLDRLDITGNSEEIPPMLKARGEAPKQAASPDQGKSNSTGGQVSGAKNDQRTDQIENLRSEMALGDLLSEVRSLVAQVKELKG